MADWIASNATLLGIVINLITAGVWIIYLHVLVRNLKRQRRSNILINRSAGKDDHARCVVSNMGAEPIYISSIIVDMDVDGETCSAVVTDRLELSEEEVSNPLQRTNQGALESGHSQDLGNFKELAERALSALGKDESADRVSRMVLTVAAATGHDAYLAAGQQTFYVAYQEGRHIYLPTATLTRQIRNMRERRSLRRRLDQVLREEAKAVQTETTVETFPGRFQAA